MAKQNNVPKAKDNRVEQTELVSAIGGQHWIIGSKTPCWSVPLEGADSGGALPSWVHPPAPEDEQDWQAFPSAGHQEEFQELSEAYLALYDCCFIDEVIDHTLVYPVTPPVLCKLQIAGDGEIIDLTVNDFSGDDEVNQQIFDFMNHCCKVPDFAWTLDPPIPVSRIQQSQQTQMGHFV